jgi:sugar transferase EpsL
VPKRLVDCCAAFLGLIVVAPLLFVVAMLIWAKLGSPIIFTQVRSGLHGQPFWLFKFRTMTDARDSDGTLLSDAERIPPFGQWLRATSLDELPELWNVLKGDMSLVGPRPLLTHYLDRYTLRQGRRHEVRPGITGWAQVNGRNALSWEEKLELDVWYVENQGLWLDMRILARTVMSVLRRDGVSADQHVTMPEFMGSQVNSTAKSGNPTKP